MRSFSQKVRPSLHEFWQFHDCDCLSLGGVREVLVVDHQGLACGLCEDFRR